MGKIVTIRIEEIYSDKIHAANGFLGSLPSSPVGFKVNGRRVKNASAGVNEIGFHVRYEDNRGTHFILLTPNSKYGKDFDGNVVTIEVTGELYDRGLGEGY